MTRIALGTFVLLGIVGALFPEAGFLLTVFLALVTFAVAAGACLLTSLVFRWALKLLLAPAPRAAAALAASLALHAVALWDGWNPLAALPLGFERGPAAALAALLVAHVPAAILLLRQIPEAAPPARRPNA